MSRPRHSSALPVSSSAAAPKVYGEGRVCNYPSCMTQLSRYNDSTYCYLHVPDGRAPRRTF